MRIVLRFPFLLASLVLSGSLIAVALLTDLDPVRSGIAAMENLDGRYVDDLVVAALLVVIAGGLDAARNARKLEAESLRLQTLQATMRTVQDLVGNALNNLLLFRMEAEEHVSAEALQQFDRIIHDTTDRISQLANVHVVIERNMAAGAGINYGVASNARE